MGIYFKPDMATSVEVPNVEAVLILQRQIFAAHRLETDHEARAVQPAPLFLSPASAGHTPLPRLPLTRSQG